MSPCQAIFYSATHNLQEMTKNVLCWGQFCDYGVDSYILPFDSRHIRPFQGYFGRLFLHQCHSKKCPISFHPTNMVHQLLISVFREVNGSQRTMCSNKSCWKSGFRWHSLAVSEFFELHLYVFICNQLFSSTASTAYLPMYDFWIFMYMLFFIHPRNDVMWCKTIEKLLKYELQWFDPIMDCWKICACLHDSSCHIQKLFWNKQFHQINSSTQFLDLQVCASLILAENTVIKVN